MNWIQSESQPWEEPLAFASRFAGRDMAFLYSSLQENGRGNASFLFVDMLEEKNGSDWSKLPKITTSNSPLPIWVGYLGYGMREDDARGSKSFVTLPDFRLIRYAHLYRFDHQAHTIDYYTTSLQGLKTEAIHFKEPELPPFARNDAMAIRNFASNLTRAEYESIITATIEQIRNGNFYQANITRKFFGESVSTPDSWQVFERLCNASPAPYSAYIRHGSNAILSSSPECFLTIAADGTITTRPIKGSARRDADADKDQLIRDDLLSSRKNHAENLMIVDLMRNDLSRVSKPQTVAVVEQSALHSYSTIHHLISTIRAKKSTHVSAYEAVRACFPAGSMTGAPKIAAMHWCTREEKLERGVYSGAIGWFGAHDTCDLSVVIRTLILDGNRFEFQVGGGIVADSTPEDEWRETITKARGILAALGLNEADLEIL